MKLMVSANGIFKFSFYFGDMHFPIHTKSIYRSELWRWRTIPTIQDLRFVFIQHISKTDEMVVFHNFAYIAIRMGRIHSWRNIK